ncbi:MAG TPA: hydroxyethylthiazole kinase [Lichenihabitans sp.]|nr:hydroxyethylthiazole kinase [Lichenihabitans sp.]
MNETDEETGRVALARQLAKAMARLRERRPLVQNITNFVSMDIVANALLAAGATPAMVHAREEVEDFGRIADALVVNIGTLSAEWVESMRLAAKGAQERRMPWVLDPVGAGATPFRTKSVADLCAHGPTVIRGNASEILAVATALGLQAVAARGRGVDSGNTTDEAAGAAGELARKLGATVVATGEIDVVTDGTRTLRFANGSILMTLVTATGCSLSALTGAYLAVATDPFEAACVAVAHVGVAGELAGEDASLPGMFRVAFIDRLASVGEAEILTRLRLA